MKPDIKYNIPSRTSVEWFTFISEHIPFINFIVNDMFSQYSNKALSRDDLFSAAQESFTLALNSFSPLFNTQFRTYVEKKMKWAILDEIRNNDHTSTKYKHRQKKKLKKVRDTLEQRCKRAVSSEDMINELNVEPDTYFKLQQTAMNYTGVDIDEMRDHPVSKEVNPSELVHNKELAIMLGKLVNKVLTEKERVVISLYYQDDLNMAEIGSVLNVSESRISQLHTKAIKKLKNELIEVNHDEEKSVDYFDRVLA